VRLIDIKKHPALLEGTFYHFLREKFRTRCHTTTTVERMFVLVSIEDKIKVNPDLFDQDLTEVTDSDISYPLFSLPNL
jgi:hypothetical protein